MDALLLELMAQGMHQVIGQYGYEQVASNAIFFMVVDRREHAKPGEAAKQPF
jgi:hypothetical protein